MVSMCSSPITWCALNSHHQCSHRQSCSQMLLLYIFTNLSILLIYSGLSSAFTVEDLPSYNPHSEGKKVITLGYLTGSNQHPGDIYYRKPGQAISGAITKAVDEINADPHTLPNHVLEFLIAETYGQEDISIRLAATLPIRNISAYIGPQETCIHEGRIAAAFNLPMISYYCAHYEVSDKEKYRTFARTKPHDSRISMSVVSLLHRYNWHKVTFIHSDRAANIADTINSALKDNGINVTERRFYEGPYFHDQLFNPFSKIVSETYQTTRIYLMLGEFYEFVGLMVALYLRGLLDTGEYFVVGVDTMQYDPNDPAKYLEGLFQDSATMDSIEAFRSFIGIAPASPIYPQYEDFSKVVNQYLESPPFNFLNPYSIHGKIKKLRPEAAFLYDAVWLYARAAHKAIEDGTSPSNGTAIFELIKGTTYQSAMGYTMSIDQNGDAEGNFTLLARKYKNKSWGIFPIGMFALNQNLSGPPVMELFTGEKIDWIGDGPPVDEPKCGFFGERCIPGPNYTPQIVGGVLGGLSFIVIVIAVIAYRNWRYEQELTSLLWKIDYRDIVMKDHTSQYTGSYTGHSINRMATGLRSSMMSLSSQVDLDLRQVFTQVGTYKKSIVAVKRVNKKYVDLTRNVRKELKMMRDIRHDNLNTFIGACVDPGNVSIVTEYCSKGSLQDILANDDVKLDNMFIASLVFDIIKGMTYLHDSVIRFHGSLKSSNCVVDSRLMLKITDYGLWEFKSGGDPDADMSEHTHYQSLLWTAPELLREASTIIRGSPKGDVYSFAIILYELHGRAGPYGDIDLSPKEIIQRVVRRDGDIPFRPKLGALGTVPKHITDTIKDCWNENPLIRPDFKTIRSKLKPMQKGMKPNIFDNMMAIMEKYATNLEELVEEKTDQLREEKKRTEELLNQMLPRPVAEQLKLGKQVEAEVFESVSIYFSDICGFTSMSSESTPMQVVDLLNDLYTTFDSIIESYDVYKVETIGDAYMVVSGLPTRNGKRHAGEIASMSLHLLCAIKRFKIRHRPNDTLKLRIGIHSGSCVAGVVGQKMPRYCLFGDTVNTASRMESNGLPLRIHCSETTKELLDILGGYHLEDRGLVTMKGKGQVRTFWVLGEDKERRMSRLKPPKSAAKSPRTVEGKTPPVLHKVLSTPIMRHGTLRGNHHGDHNSKSDSDFKESDRLINGVVSHGEGSYRERQGSGESFGSRRRSAGDSHLEDHDFSRKRNSRTSEILRIQVNDELMDVESPPSPTLNNGDEEAWSAKSPVSRDSTYCSEEESPLLRYGSLSEKCATSGSCPKLKRSSTEETSV